MTRVLLVNDDGVHRAGLAALRDALLAEGFGVTTIAPAANRSGAGRCVTIHDAVEVALLADGGDPVYACTGSPADCVRLGLLAELGPPPDIVASGINHGANVAEDVGYSGTIGAALEAAALGRPGVAFSQQAADGGLPLRERAPHAFDLADVAAAIMRRVAEDPPPPRCALSVNLPARLGDWPPVALTVPARRVVPERGWLAPDRVDGRVMLYRPWTSGGPDPGLVHDDDGDVAALAAGRVSVTPLALGGGDPAGWAAGLDLATAVAAALERRSG